MPELKRVFNAGKMNRDLDDRLVPPGEYREALNVNIGRSEGSDVGAVENLLGNSLVGATGLTDARCIGSYRDNGNERVFFFVTTNNSADETNGGTHRIYEYDQPSRNLRILVDDSQLNFHKLFPISGVNLIDDLLFWTDNRNAPRKINIDRARNDNTYYSSATEIDDLISVAKYAPFEAATIVSVGTTDVNGVEIDSNFLEDKLPRFSYRWRFEDGEYSTIAPFTPIVFSRLNDGESIDFNAAVAEGEVRTFVNAVKSATIQVPTPAGFGITEVELIYKETTSQTLYIVEDRPVAGTTTENFVYASQDPFRTLPPNQLTRLYDAVPRRALSQEIAGSRVVYGNFLQNYNLPNIDFNVTRTGEDSARLGQIRNQSVKSRRTYQVGIVLADRYGRQSPVILSNSGGDTVFINAGAGDASNSNVFNALRITFADPAQIPDWAYSYRVVVKQREQEYYNWFTSGTANMLTRTGDSVNKIPVDQTASVERDANTRPSSASVYRKIEESGAGPTNVEDNELFRVSITADGPAQVAQAALVYETEPVISNLDIFFETSTGGLIEDINQNVAIDIAFYNCYLVSGTGVHVEANRLRLGFNEPSFDYGVRAYILQENFAEERRFNTLIHSGLFNSRTGFNQLNQFNESEGGITISLDPQDGSIQKLFAEDTQIIIFQEDKVSRSPVDKDFIFSSEGGAVPVTSNTQFLGTIAPYSGEYGISTDPLSFAVYGNRKYFTDRNRGVVLRLSNDGLVEISKAGMSDFFRDALRTATSVIGSFDEYHDTYNLTIVGEGYIGSVDTNVATAAQGYLTVSFEEDVRGWSSFKSFNQESGLTLNNLYYTFSGGDLWEHNSTAVPRNVFYQVSEPFTPAPSYVDVIFNDAPSVVKEFKTIGYEGTAGWSCDYIQTDIRTIGEPPAITPVFRTTLQINGSANNSTIRGERSILAPTNTPVEWVIIASPISSLFRFDPDVPISQSISLSSSSAVVTNPTTITDDGRLVFRVSATTGATDSIVPVTLTGNGAVEAFDFSILTITVRDNVADANITPASVGFSPTDDGNLEFTVSAFPEFYIDANNITFDTSGASAFGIQDPVVQPRAANSDNLTYRTSLTIPTDVSQGFIQVNGMATSYPTLTWQLPDPVPANASFNRDILIYPVSPFSLDVDKTIVLTITAADDMVFTGIPDITATNSDSVTSIISNEGGVSNTTILSNIEFTDTTTAIAIVNQNIATASLEGQNPYNDFIFGANDGTPGNPPADQSFVYNGNVTARLSVPADGFITLNGDTASVQVNPGETVMIGALENDTNIVRDNILTLSSTNTRVMPALADIEITITQDA